MQMQEHELPSLRNFKPTKQGAGMKRRADLIIT
jgi:hypothetical protein